MMPASTAACLFCRVAERSCRLASYLTALGLKRGERVLVRLPNCVALWESMLAAIRMGAVIIPATTLLEQGELTDRLARGEVRAVITLAQLTGRFAQRRPGSCASRSVAACPAGMRSSS